MNLVVYFYTAVGGADNGGNAIGTKTIKDGSLKQARYYVDDTGKDQ